MARSQAGEAFVLASGFKTTVGDIYLDEGDFANIDNGYLDIPADTSIYQWNAKTTENSLFFNADYTGELLVKVFSWSSCRGLMGELDCNAIISIAIGIDQKNIEQATDLIENVGI